MVSKLLNISLLAFCWLLSLIVPHFQTVPGVLDLSLDTLIAALLFFSLTRLLGNRTVGDHLLNYVLLVFFLGGFVLGVGAIKLGKPLFYDYWSHFGAGPMTLDGKIFLYGDLVHLTAVVKCSEKVEIGENICDPWGRLYNQNPLVGQVFKFLDLSNTFLVGSVIFVLFISAIFFSIRMLNIRTPGIFILLASPAVVLAVDRGNELMTITLIIYGTYFLNRRINASQIIGAGFLGLAVIYKIWPIFLVVSILAIDWLRLKLAAKLILLVAIIYFLMNSVKFREISDFTQGGSPFGVSFGLKLFFSSQVNNEQIFFLLAITLVITCLLIKKLNTPLETFLNSSVGQRAILWMLPSMATYIGIWAFSDSFIYRMVIFIPLILVLSSVEISTYSWSWLMQAAVLTTTIAGRLPITIAISSSLAIYFIYVIILVGIRSKKSLFKLV